jgi:Na+/proline symporter
MLTLFREGGFPIWFLLLFGGLALSCGARFAMRPDSARLRLTAALGLATLLTTITCICADLAMVGHHAPEYLAQHPSESLSAVLLQGFAESMSPAILGFTVLTLVALFIALGSYRESLQA